MKRTIISILYLSLIVEIVVGATTNPVQDYLSHTHLGRDNHLLEIATSLGPDSGNVIFLSTTKQAVSGGQIWEVYAATQGGYVKLTNQEQASADIVVFDPDQALVDESSHSLIYFVNGGGGHGAIRSIKIVNGTLQDTPLAFMGPDTKDPDWASYKKYFDSGYQKVPVKSLATDELSAPPPSNLPTPSQLSPHATMPSKSGTEANPDSVGHQEHKKNASQPEIAAPQTPNQVPATAQAASQAQLSAEPPIATWLYGLIALGLVLIGALGYFLRSKK